MKIVGSPVTLRKHKEHIHWSETVNIARKICIKCGTTAHKFFQCNIPKDTQSMTEEQKAARYCCTCGKHTDHTTLDHRMCPAKRDIIREWARVEREKRELSISSSTWLYVGGSAKSLIIGTDEKW